MDINILIAALPSVNSWIDGYIAKHANSKVRLSDAGFSRLPGYFSSQLLESSYYVLVPRIESPPLSDLGLGALSFFEGGNYGGITYKDTFFATSRNESLHFHEMIHIIQWNELGPEKFLLAYGVGLVRFGYRNSPLEQIAYSMQAQFDARQQLEDVESIVRKHCREVIQTIG
ncbi:MAG: hypothetical protein J0M04_11540 [Verrucomicrobia bacterium]|nr:hypothetical protein [Verrucomicrobiota bacterium]